MTMTITDDVNDDDNNDCDDSNDQMQENVWVSMFIYASTLHV